MIRRHGCEKRLDQGRYSWDSKGNIVDVRVGNEDLDERSQEEE